MRFERASGYHAQLALRIPRFAIPKLSFIRLIPLACACALAACTFHTPLPALPDRTPPQWQSAQENAPDAMKPDLDSWWKAFNDPQLDALIDTALKDNLGVAAAGLRVQAARRLEHRASKEFWPNLNFRIYEETAPGATTGYFEMGFDAQWEFGFFGRAKANSRMAMADANTALIDEAAARATLTAEVAKTYVELRAAQERARAAQELVAVRKQRAQLMQVRVRTRLASQLEADHAQAELQQALADAGEPAAAERAASEALAVLLGRMEPDAAWSNAPAQPQLPAIAIDQAPANLVRTRPEIRRAEQNVLRAAGELGIARADLFPKLGLAGSLISATPLTGDVDHPEKAVPLVGPTLQIPIWDWGMRRDVVGAREAALSASVLAYRQAVLEGVAEVETALANFADKTARAKSADASLALAQRAAESAQALQRIGLGDALDASQAKLSDIEAKMQQANAQRERALAFIALYKAFGGTLPGLEEAQ